VKRGFPSENDVGPTRIPIRGRETTPDALSVFTGCGFPSLSFRISITEWLIAQTRLLLDGPTSRLVNGLLPFRPDMRVVLRLRRRILGAHGLFWTHRFRLHELPPS